VLANLAGTGQFSRKTWGILSLELWQQQFHDRAAYYQRMPAEQAIRLAEVELAAR
jgi:asparagine synthase (glutamine-hydrolysing)